MEASLPYSEGWMQINIPHIYIVVKSFYLVGLSVCMEYIGIYVISS